MFRGQRHNSVDIDKPAAAVQIKLEFRRVGFCGHRKPREKSSEQGKNQEQTQPT